MKRQTHQIIITYDVISIIIEIFTEYIGTIEETVVSGLQSCLGFYEFGIAKGWRVTHRNEIAWSVLWMLNRLAGLIAKESWQGL